MSDAHDTTPLGDALAAAAPACVVCADTRKVIMTNGRDAFLERCPNCGGAQ
jgi:hypothetical protein